MATRQYIGARYVPKFYKNSVDGSTQWEPNVVYQPLIYVTLQNGHMYISKKQVPATVGTPASNVDYWLDMGSYNGFIDQLQDEIDDLTADVAALTNLIGRKFLFVGDSYGDNPNIPGDSWGKQAAIAMKLDASQWENLCRGGFKWYDGSTYLDEITNYTGNRSEVTDIVICAGANDVNTSFINITNAMQDFAAYVKTNYPNAKIWCGWIGFGTPLQGTSGMRTAYNAYECCGVAGMAYMPNLIAANHNYGNLIDSSYHPDAVALRRIGWSVANILTGGYYRGNLYAEDWLTEDTTLLEAIADSTISSYKGYLRFKDDDIQIRIQRAIISFSPAKTFTNDTNISICKIKKEKFRPTSASLVTPGNLTYSTDGGVTYHVASGYYATTKVGDDVTLQFHSQEGTLSNVNLIIATVNIDYPLIMC